MSTINEDVVRVIFAEEEKIDDHVFESEIEIPSFNPNNYKVWKNKVELWAEKSDIDEEKLAPTIFFSLTGEAKQKVLENDISLLKGPEGIRILYAILDKLYDAEPEEKVVTTKTTK